MIADTLRMIKLMKQMGRPSRIGTRCKLADSPLTNAWRDERGARSFGWDRAESACVYCRLSSRPDLDGFVAGQESPFRTEPIDARPRPLLKLRTELLRSVRKRPTYASRSYCGVRR